MGDFHTSPDEVPDGKYEGPITIQLVNDLIDRFEKNLKWFTSYNPAEYDNGWLDCKLNWVKSLQEAALNCIAILTILECDLDIEDAEDRHRRVIFLCQLILQDFNNAKKIDFHSK